MFWRLLKTVVILPGTVLVFIPSIIAFLTPVQPLTVDKVLFWVGLILLGIGLFMAAWTVKLFVKVGSGTPAPWDPPENLVVMGPYRHVRNPMLTSTFFILLAESILLQSVPIAVWLGIFIVINLIYMPLVEEKRLEERFGEEYLQYKRNVPGWIPRLKPWS